MNQNGSSSSSSSSSSSGELEEANYSSPKSDSEQDSFSQPTPAHDIHQQPSPSSRSLNTLKPRSLQMDDTSDIFPEKILLKTQNNEEDEEVDDSQTKNPKEGAQRSELNQSQRLVGCETEERASDEIAILKAILDYYSKNGTYPFDNLNAFREFLKVSVQIDVGIEQLRDVVSELKKKFTKIRERESGEPETMGPHENRVFELAKKIWGNHELENVPKEEEDGDGKKKLNQSLGLSGEENEEGDTTETAILKAILDFYTKNGNDPVDDLNLFLDFLRDSFQIDVGAEKLREMIPELRERFGNIQERGSEKTELLGTREKEIFELSKKIWGNHEVQKADEDDDSP